MPCKYITPLLSKQDSRSCPNILNEKISYKLNNNIDNNVEDNDIYHNVWNAYNRYYDPIISKEELHIDWQLKVDKQNGILNIYHLVY